MHSVTVSWITGLSRDRSYNGWPGRPSQQRSGDDGVVDDNGGLEQEGEKAQADDGVAEAKPGGDDHGPGGLKGEEKKQRCLSPPSG